MSRTYLLCGELKGMYADQIWNLLSQWCGHSQIFKVVFDESDIEEEGYFYVEMGCSSGIQPEETMYCLKEQLEELGAKDVNLVCWSMHPDKIECGVKSGDSSQD